MHMDNDCNDCFNLQANLAVQQNKHNIANERLEASLEILKAKDEALKIVQAEFDGVMAERQIIVDQADACQAKMDAATALIDGLSGEKIRWTSQLAQFKSETERLIGDVLILTGFLSYCGPFNQEFRILLQRQWFDLLQTKRIPVSLSASIVDALSDTATVNNFFFCILTFILLMIIYLRINIADW